MLIKNKGKKLDIEWELIFGLIKDFLLNKIFQSDHEAIASLKTIYSAIRNLFLNGCFNGIKERMMESFNEVKNIINDSLFDTLYIHNLRTLPLSEVQDKLYDMMNMQSIINLKATPENQDDYDYRIGELLNAFEFFYKTSEDMEMQFMLEKLFIQKAKEYNGLKLKIDSSLKVIRILGIMGEQTISNENFASIVEFFAETIIKPDVIREDTHKSPNKQKSPIQRNGIILANAAHQILFQLFHKSYLIYPPIRLLTILNSFIQVLETSYKEIKITTLRFWINISYDHNYNIYLKDWKASSYLGALDTEINCFPAQIIVNKMTDFLKKDIDMDIILLCLDVLISLCKSHYGLNKVNISKLIDDLASFGFIVVQQKEADAASKAVEILQLLATQKNVETDPEEVQIVKTSLNDAVKIMCAFHNQLKQISSLFKAEIDEFKKSKLYKKVINQPTRINQELDYLQKHYFKFSKLVQDLMSAISSICSVCQENIWNVTNDLFEIIRIFTNDQVLTEKFASSIQKVIANVYYSGIISKLSPEQIINIIDICIQIGWRNIFYTCDQQVTSLMDYMFNKASYSFKTLFINTDANRVAAQVSQLTFPAGETGNKFQEEMDLKLKIKGKVVDTMITHFGYQRDSNIVMHLTTENIINYFVFLPKDLHADVLSYITKIAALETRNEQSPIIQHTLILTELANWFANTNLERISKEDEELKNGKLWLINE